MPKHLRLHFATAVTLVAMFAVAGSALASEAGVSPAGRISSPSVGQLTFTGSGISIRCELTLNGSLLSGPIDTAGTGQIGELSEVTINRPSCSGGSIGGVLDLPWRLHLVRTLGTAPNAVTGLLFEVRNHQVLFDRLAGFDDCLYAGNLGFLMAVTAIPRTSPQQYRTGTITALLNIQNRISGAFCPSTLSTAGSFTITAQTITIR